MSTPDQLGDGDRKIPIGERSRKRIGNTLYELLAAIRRKDGADPERYPSVGSDIQYDIRRTMYGAEMAARETADLLMPAILTGHAPVNFRRTRALLRHPLTAAMVILAVMFGEREFRRSKSAPRNEPAVQQYEAAAEQIQKLTEANKTLNSDLVTVKETLRRDLASARMRQTSSEVIGDAVLKQGMVLKINTNTVTLTIPKASAKASGQNWLLELQHKMSPDQIETLKESLQDSKSISPE